MQDRRAEPRLMCADMVEVQWTDESGQHQQTTALLDDIAPSGACLNLDNPLPLGTAVVIRYRNGRLEGSVSYCFFRDIGYYVGVHFKPHTRWSPKQYRPKYLLDLKKLLTKRTPAKHKAVQ
jgi:hypothetical protein